jgi:hypothetical protein
VRTSSGIFTTPWRTTSAQDKVSKWPGTLWSSYDRTWFSWGTTLMITQVSESASGQSPMQEVRGSSPVSDKDFQVRMRRSNYLRLVTLTSFGWDDKPRSSVCTHSEHKARTIKILQSLCVSHKIVEPYRNQHAQCILSDSCQ